MAVVVFVIDFYLSALPPNIKKKALAFQSRWVAQDNDLERILAVFLSFYSFDHDTLRDFVRKKIVVQADHAYIMNKTVCLSVKVKTNAGSILDCRVLMVVEIRACKPSSASLCSNSYSVFKPTILEGPCLKKKTSNVDCDAGCDSYFSLSSNITKIACSLF